MKKPIVGIVLELQQGNCLRRYIVSLTVVVRRGARTFLKNRSETNSYKVCLSNLGMNMIVICLSTSRLGG